MQSAFSAAHQPDLETGAMIQARLLVPILALLLSAAVLASTTLGYLQISWPDVIRTVMARISGRSGTAADLDPLISAVVLDVRLPRILTAAVVGGGLSICGLVFQAILLNPLADPYTLGVSAGAAFGASLAIILNMAIAGSYSVPLFAFGGAATTLAAVICLSAGAGGWSSNNLILSGIIVAAILSAGISFLKYMADEHVAVIIFWLMGSFASRTWTDVGMTFGCVAAGSLVFVIYARDLNLLTLGERSAAALGVNTRKVPLILLITASLVAAVCVSVSGIIGFVGLLVPHMMRTIAGPDHRRLVPISVLAGAILLLCADTVSRAVLPHEIPVGILTALIGGPFFCYLFRKRQTSRKGF